jgi:hypothetical protein
LSQKSKITTNKPNENKRTKTKTKQNKKQTNIEQTKA